MALKSTIFKAELNIADLDRGYYATHGLTVARHPSETDERMMLRVLAFALHADDALAFGRGISDEDEPALWRRNLLGEAELWIDLGQPDEKRIKKACTRAAEAVIYAYGGRAAEMWWQGIASQAARYEHLSVWRIDDDALAALGALAERGMNLHVTVQDGEITLADGERSVPLVLQRLK
ncbi:YaeQ family protein [Chitiniphilus purpureus]|uniref:YaeQ family protein n=1 Tax=Chitiniphilus purpureus TaxID=2981137 RepID=A0ABY6DNN6_9NEIS|nr:YaeQ family protein [Chitiniphilus sp. CD1]UXY15632.1 YaeQ family protein [Chitiniphilus sp. CD1]